MSNVKQGNVTASKEWAKHLRPFGKQQFWSAERGAQRAQIADELGPDTDPEWSEPQPDWHEGAVFASPIINAYHGYSYDSTRPEGTESRLVESEARMSIKSQNWVGTELSPGFYYQMMEGEYYFGQKLGAAHCDTFAHQDFYAMFMGL